MNTVGCRTDAAVVVRRCTALVPFLFELAPSRGATSTHLSDMLALDVQLLRISPFQEGWTKKEMQFVELGDVHGNIKYKNATTRIARIKMERR